VEEIIDKSEKLVKREKMMYVVWKIEVCEGRSWELDVIIRGKKIDRWKRKVRSMRKKKVEKRLYMLCVIYKWVI